MKEKIINDYCRRSKHTYAAKTCEVCKAVFCYGCCRNQNLDQGGKYEPDFMLCPVCGHDYYADLKIPL